MVNEQGGTLVAHNPKFQCEIVKREELGRFECPTGTSVWRPVPHVELVETLHEQLASMDMRVGREQYAVGRKGLALFGVLDIVGQLFNGNSTRAMALGLRQSNDKQLAIHITGGARVFVCDNLALSGETLALQKHFRRASLGHVIRQGLERFLKSFHIFNQGIVRAENTPMTDADAKVKLFDLRYDGVLPVSIYDEAASNYFRAEKLGYEDSAPRTSWGLHNACTRAVKALAPTSQQRILTGLGRAFALAG
jgi:hypothetical protein